MLFCVACVVRVCDCVFPFFLFFCDWLCLCFACVCVCLLVIYWFDCGLRFLVRSLRLVVMFVCLCVFGGLFCLFVDFVCVLV